MKYVPINLIDLDGASPEELIIWLVEEALKVRHRFGPDDGYHPDNYYEKMEIWWKSPRRELEPIICRKIKGVYFIEDGWHRIAISHKLQMKDVPIEIVS